MDSKRLKLIILLLALIYFGYVIYINVFENNDEFVKTTETTENGILIKVPSEVINFPETNDEEVTIKKITDLTNEDINLIKEKGGNVLKETDDDYSKEIIFYFYKNHIVEYWNQEKSGFGKLILDNKVISDYAVSLVNDPRSIKQFIVTPVIYYGELYYVAKSSSCFKYEGYGTINALDYHMVKLDDNYDNEDILIKTFKAKPEGSLKGPKCER